MKQRRRWLVLTVGVGLAAIAAVLLWPTDRSRIQGTWVGGGIHLTFHGDLAVLEWDGLPRQSRTYFRLDSWASPPRIVVFDADAPSVHPPTRILGVPVGGHRRAGRRTSAGASMSCGGID
jgi:hypothetical protein